MGALGWGYDHGVPLVPKYEGVRKVKRKMKLLFLRQEIIFSEVPFSSYAIMFRKT